MHPKAELTSLSIGELVALVNELRGQLQERDREITRLRSLLPREHSDALTQDTASDPSPGRPTPGSQEDLLAQLEKIYPAG